jgi:hypothetical protein
MPDYRRNRVPGGTYFFTVNLLERSNTLLASRVRDESCVIRRKALRFSALPHWDYRGPSREGRNMDPPPIYVQLRFRQVAPLMVTRQKA